MQDVIVLERLRERGMLNLPYTELMPYEAMERRARILDKAPKVVTLSRVNEINPCGTAQKFTMIYNQLLSENNLEMGTLDLRGTKRYCDASVFIVLQSLIRLSMNKSLDLVSAACDIFKLLITHPCDTLTEGVMYELLKTYTPCNFYAKELVDGIHISVFKEKATALYWKSLCEFSGFYTEALPLGMKVIGDTCAKDKDVRSFCTKYYKEAKGDEAFMSKIYKPGANRYLIAMLWYLHNNGHPDLLDIGVPDIALKESANYSEDDF